MSIASPESTGHAGPFFEQHVDAAFLALLLVRGVAPFLLRAEITELHLQSAHLGWATDDLLVVGVGPDGHHRRAALSVKRTFTMAKTDPECVDVFMKAWTDFKSTTFNADHDMLGLITRPGSAQMVHGLTVLLETARASVDGADLTRRLALPKYRDKRAREYASTIRQIIEEAHACSVFDDDLHGFLSSFDFACLDLNTPSSSIEALLLTLLRTCAASSEPASVGIETWNELVRIVSANSQMAKSFRWIDLPLQLRQRFSVSNAYVGSLLEPFEEMTRTVCNGVDTSIAGHHEPRSELEQQAIDLLDSNRVLLIGGLAGGGKSAVAKAVFAATGRGRFALALRAEMLARPSIGEFLVAMGTSIKKLREAMALHTSKILWIDGAERLLEKPASERGAFNEMMRLVREDPAWRIVITCRAYSLETFKSAFLDQYNIVNTVLVIPALSSVQLDSFAAHCPQLARPLSNAQLRSLFVNPFFLKMAARMKWDRADPLPTTERTFRAQVWKQTIRRDDEISDGMPLKRDATYIQIARRRAQSLDAFVDVQDLDAAAVLKLNADTLLLESDDHRGRYAPSHDVLEDWALLEWIDREYERARSSWSQFLGALGTHPAIRRTFRVWLTERIEADPSALKAAAAVITDAALPRHWTDDVLVALLRSHDPVAFLAETERALLESNAQLLQRVIHLVRVACQQPPTGRSDEIGAGAARPLGLVWQRVAEFVAAHLDEVVLHCTPLLLRFLEDWCTCVTAADPYPAGSTAIGSIACRILDGMDVHAYSRDADTTRILKVLLRIPREVEGRIRLVTAESLEGRFWAGAPFVELVFSHWYGGQLCRDFPEIPTALAERLLAPPRPPLPEHLPFGERETLAQSFGLAAALEDYGHPPSALHGPFLNLLRLHPRDGLQFLIETINRCSATYLASHSEGFECHFELPDGKIVTHQGDGRLWAMYRVNSGPDVLCSMLMALESWLLELGDRGWTDILRTVVFRVMQHATSLALSAVVASAVMAFPEQLGDLAIAFLRNRELFHHDRARCLGDQTRTDKMFATKFPARDVESRLFDQERIQAAEQPHRRSHFEALARRLQAGPLRDNMLKVLDDHAAVLPSTLEQDDTDRLWRLALYRMDSRNVQMRTEPDGSDTILVTPPPADVQAVVDRALPGMAAKQRGMAAFLWGQSRYERKDDPTYSATEWREQLEHVRTQPAISFSDARLIVSVVSLRDFYEEMTSDQRAWCVDMVCAAFSGDIAHGGAFGFGPVSGVREAARELGGMLVTVGDAEQRGRLERALVRALLVEEHEISRHASIGIGRDLWKHDPQLAMSLAAALDCYTHREFKASMSLRRMSPTDERDPAHAGRAREQLKAEMETIVTERRADIASLIANDFRKSPARFILRELANMLCWQADDPSALAFVATLSEQLRATWDADRRGLSRHDDREGFDHQTEHFVGMVICAFGLGLSERQAGELFAPYRQLASRYPENVAKLLRELALKEDDRFRPGVFWSLWTMLSNALIDRVNAMPDPRDSVLDAIAEALFFDLPWKETTIEWRSLLGHEAKVADAFSRLRPCEAGIERFARFLSTIGSGLMPDVLPLLARKLGEPGATLSDRAVTLLEKSLANRVYTGAPRIRHEHTLRDATLTVLDVLIEAGSSKAYRMRDDFVTPLRVEAGG
jgi:hypothetical protein